MNRVVGLALFLLVLAVAAFVFSPRPLPVFPATAVAPAQLIVLALAAADKRLIAVGERGVILLSDDDGRQWRPAKSPSSATLTAVHFVDARHGFAVGHDAVILATADAGENWRQVHAAPADFKPLFAVWFENAERGVAVGAYGAYYETADGGRSWQAKTVLDGDRHFNALAGGPDGKVYLVGESGLLARSDDAGRNWSPLVSPYKGSFFGVLRLPAKGVLIFGLRGNVFRSDDEGANWVAVAPPGLQATLQGGALLPGGGVVLVGREGAQLESRDGGATFVAGKSADGRALAAVWPLAGGARINAGENGVARREAAAK